jgi:hypothetical protein
MILTVEDRSTKRETSPSISPFTILNPTLTGLELNPGLRGERTSPTASATARPHLSLIISISQRGVPQNFTGAYATNRGINT